MKFALSLSALLALLLAGPHRVCHAGSEAALKAQVIQRVLLFVKWPPATRAPGQPLEMCLADDTPLAEALRALSRSSPEGFAMRTRRLPAPDALDGCHAVYLGRQAAAVLAAPRRSGVLLIGDAHGLIEQGAMLNLQVAQGRIAFDVGLSAAREAGLEIGARVLRLARYVKES